MVAWLLPLGQGVLETTEGLVFEGADGGLYRAEFDTLCGAIEGPLWRVFALDIEYTPEDGSPQGGRPVVAYYEFATEDGRRWGSKTPRQGTLKSN